MKKSGFRENVKSLREKVLHLDFRMRTRVKYSYVLEYGTYLLGILLTVRVYAVL